MRELRIQREVARREARRALGMEPTPHGRRNNTVGVLRQGLSAEHLALPQDVEYLTAIQNADGTFVYMVGFDGLGEEALG